MVTINSTSNDNIKRITALMEKAKQRRKEGCFIVEGIKMYREIPKGDLDSVYVSETFAKDNPDVIKEMDSGSDRCFCLGDGLFKKISGTVTPQGVLAIVRQKKCSFDDVMSTTHSGRNCFVVLDRIQDPGNLGTIVRTGEGAGINGIIMSDTTVDIYNPKVIRSTMGSVFRVPFCVVSDLPEAVERLKQAGVTCYAAHLKGEAYNREAFSDKTALLIGNEANGLSDEVAEKADRLIKIPMQGKVESLNAAIATAILMYQVEAGSPMQ